MQMILAYLRRPSTWVLLVIGAILALAYGRFVGPLRTAARVLPKSEA